MFVQTVCTLLSVLARSCRLIFRDIRSTLSIKYTEKEQMKFQCSRGNITYRLQLTYMEALSFTFGQNQRKFSYVMIAV